jgi:hypothetical protein
VQIDLVLNKESFLPFGLLNIARWYSDICNIADAVQYVRVVRKLARKPAAIGMDDIRFVAPDAAGDRLCGDYLAEMVKDYYIIGKLACWGVHQL